MRWSPAALCLTLLFSPFAPLQASQAPPPADGPVLKDPAEYNAYMKALGLSDPAAKSAAFETFISTYPGSVMIPDALRQAMAAYQTMADFAKVSATARRLLVLQPGDLPSLAIMAFISRIAATKGDAAALTDMRGYAERGLQQLQVQKSQQDTNAVKLREQMSAIFYGARGLALISDKQYSQARDAYLKAMDAGSADLQDNYQLGIAEVQMEPLDASGFWYLARAMNLATAQKNEVAIKGIAPFAQAKYKRYHGSNDGWDAIVASAGVSGPIPAKFAESIARAPTAAEIVVKAVADNDPASLSFSDWETVLSYRDASPANTAAAAKVWAAIQAKEKGGAAMFVFPVVVVSSTSDAIEASITDENIGSHVADLHIVLSQPLLTPPATGSHFTATGVISGYEPHPFQFKMTKGRLSAIATDKPTH